MSNKYSTSVFWSEEHECFVALVQEFPGLSAVGDTHEEAVAEAQVALELMCEGYKADGEKLPVPEYLPEHSGQLRVRLPKSLHTSLSIQAQKEGVSLNTLIVSKLASSGENLEKALQRIEYKIERIGEKALALHAFRKEDFSYPLGKIYYSDSQPFMPVTVRN